MTNKEAIEILTKTSIFLIRRNGKQAYLIALTKAIKALIEKDEREQKAKASKELLHKQEQDRLAKLYGNDTHYAVIDDLPNTTEEANDNED